MSLNFNVITQSSNDLNKVDKLFYQSFPKEERMSINLLLYKSDLGIGELLAIYDENILIGFTYVITHEHLTYILYLAIDECHQSKGYGSRILSLIRNKYNQNQLILNIETLDDNAPNYTQRLKRHKFYNKNGYYNADLQYQDRFGEYEVMVHGKDEVNKEMFEVLMKAFAGYSLFLYLEITIK